MVKKHRFKGLWTKYVASVGYTLNALFLVSVVSIVLHDFVLVDSRELFDGGAELWDLLHKLSLALVGSYIFYYVVVHLKEQRDRENLLPFLEKKTYRIVGDAKGLIHSLKNASGHDFEGVYPSPDDTQTMCAAINYFDQAPLFLGDLWRNATWLEYLNYYKTRTNEAITDVSATAPFLETGYLKLLVRIEDCSYFFMLASITGVRLNNGPMMSLASELHKYFDDVKALEEFADRKLKR